jgi:excisionase family DNA binding protein
MPADHRRAITEKPTTTGGVLGAPWLSFGVLSRLAESVSLALDRLDRPRMDVGRTLVMKGSGVRVPSSAPPKSAARPRFSRSGAERVRRHWVRYWVRKRGSLASRQVPSGAFGAGAILRPRPSLGPEDTMDDQLTFGVVGDGGASPPPAFLTIAEAAKRVRCCERTIRRAIDNGALRAGTVPAVVGTRGGSRIPRRAGQRARRPEHRVRGRRVQQTRVRGVGSG